jgi:DNA repair and recombination protein RAD54B
LVACVSGANSIISLMLVKVISSLDPTSYKSGQCFLGGASKAPAPLRPFSSQLKGGLKLLKFNQPMLHKSGLTSASADVGNARPRHDPTSPNAIVMMRPPLEHQRKWNAKGLPIVDVVVDPSLCKHLRPHQVEGVKFMYECVMNLKQPTYSGAILADEM